VSAVIEKPTVDEMQAFKMPPVREGMMVAYYKGVNREANHQTAVVTRIAQGGRSVILRFFGNPQASDPVRHVDDPKLRFSEDAARNGSWDYTQEFQDQQARFTALEERVAFLEQAIDSVSSKPAKK
jgi:hypothetical protein